MDAGLLLSEKGESIVEKRQDKGFHDTGAKKHIYQFCIIPNTGFLGNPDLLLKDVELKLCFDRADPRQAILAADDQWANNPNFKLEIKDCFALTEYVSSPDLRSYFDSIDYAPLKYDYEDCEVIVKSIPQGDTVVRFDNLRGGNTPTHIFIGFIKSEALNGSHARASTRFSSHDIEYMNISLNGNSVNGYPMQIKHNLPAQSIQKFFACTDRTCNINAGKMMDPNEFMFNWIWSHKFEAEDAAVGWIGADFKLKQAYNESMSMVVWIVSQSCIAIDKFHQIEKITY